MDRLRERLVALEDQCRADWELRNHLDEAVEEGIRSQTCQFVIDTESRNSLAVDIGSRFRGLVALVVSNLRQGLPQCVVTVLTKTMADQNLERGIWQRATGADHSEVKSFLTLPTPPLRTSLGSAIKRVMPTPPTTPEPSKPASSPVSPVDSAPVTVVAPTTTTAMKMLLVKVEDQAGSRYEEVPETEAATRIGTWVSQGKRARAYRELPLRMEIRFDAAA